MGEGGVVGGAWEQWAVGCLRHVGESGPALSRKGEVCVCRQGRQASLCSPPLPKLPASFNLSPLKTLNPSLCLQVVPPPGWRPRRTKFPDLKDVAINTPIQQNVLGSKGTYK